MIIPDVSFYQYLYKDLTYKEITAYIDFEFMKAQTPGVIIRAGQNLWVDRAFHVSWEAARRAGMQRGSYWFYDSRANPKRQAELWVETLGNDTGELELWMDYEDHYGGQYGRLEDLYDFAERLRVLLPHKQLGVYTGYYYWMERISPAESYFSQYPLWIAAYGVESPKIPPTWSDWFMWQYTDNGRGYEWGVKSGNIDLNYRRGELGKSPNDGDLIAHYKNEVVRYKRENIELRNYVLQLDRLNQTGEIINV